MHGLTVTEGGLTAALLPLWSWNKEFWFDHRVYDLGSPGHYRGGAGGGVSAPREDDWEKL